VAADAVKQVAEVQAGKKAASSVRINAPLMVDYEDMDTWGKDAAFHVRDDDGKLVGEKLTAKEVRRQFGEEFGKPELYGYTIELRQSKLVKLRTSDLRELDAADRPKNNMTPAQRAAVLTMVEKIRDIRGPGKAQTRAYQQKPDRVLRLRGAEEKDIIIEHYDGTYSLVTAAGVVSKTAEPAPRSYAVVASEAALRPLFFNDPGNDLDDDDQTDCIEETLRFLGKELSGKELRVMCGVSQPARLYRKHIFDEARRIFYKGKPDGMKWHEAMAQAYETVKKPTE
jgi:hypothetical protein